MLRRKLSDRCEACGKKIRSNVIHLEAQVSPFQYRLTRVPRHNSQGWFDFHGRCAEAVLKKQWRKRS